MYKTPKFKLLFKGIEDLYHWPKDGSQEQPVFNLTCGQFNRVLGSVGRTACHGDQWASQEEEGVWGGRLLTGLGLVWIIGEELKEEEEIALDWMM